ncbi:hypothetical protein ACFQNE_15675 [Gordonia phosphorivorans]|uniref:hypothetical protein n=1 Tax=Gordonia phosphorivorans TaxID=1056982 RepID=UPI00360E0240
MKSTVRVRGKRWLFESVAVLVVATFGVNAAVPDARAATIADHTTLSTPAAKAKPSPKPKAAPKAESYQERQDRIALSTTPLFPTPATPWPGTAERTPGQSPKPHDEPETQCVSGEFATLGVIYESIVQSALPGLPPQVRDAVLAQHPRIKAEMERITVSTLALSEHPRTLGASDDDPSTKYRSPQSQAIVSGLLKIRDGKQNEAIPVANITLSQAVESAWLYFFLGVLAPARLVVETAPSVVDLRGAVIPELGFPSYSMLLSVGFAVFRMGVTQLYSTISESILDNCMARVTPEQKALAGKASEDVVYDIPIHPIIAGIADQLALADSETCTPIGDLTLARIVNRVSDSAQQQAPNAAAKRNIQAQTKQVLRHMKSVRIPHHLIPADPADWSTVGTMASYIGGAIPYVGGAPLDILIGLGHNLGEGADLAETVPLTELTVTKSLTAAYFAYHLSVHLFTEIGSALVEPIPVGDTLLISPFRIVGNALRLPLTYGLVTYHDVVRSMCLREDDTTGTGLGAEKDKRSPAPSSSTAPPSSTARSSSIRPSTPRRQTVGR